MIKKNNFLDSSNINIVAELGNYQVIEHQKDLSVSPLAVVDEYFAAKMNVRKRQLVVNLENSGCVVQSGAMQYMLGDLEMSSGVKGAKNLLGKMVASAVTKESTIKPEYSGTGTLVLEPTYRHLLLIDVAKWGNIVIDDGLFLACDLGVKQKVTARSNLSSAVLGGEGLFNLSLTGNGIAALESPVPMDELIEVTLENDVMKIDGNQAIAWSGTLEFTVEKSGKSLLGSAVSGEGLVNVYRGSGKILLAPTATSPSVETGNPTDSNSDKAPSQSKTDSFGKAVEGVSKVLDIFG